MTAELLCVRGLRVRCCCDGCVAADRWGRRARFLGALLVSLGIWVALWRCAGLW